MARKHEKTMFARNRPSRFCPRIEALEDRQLLSAYFVSPLGNDANSGTAPNQAWQTVDRANKAVLQPGDSILFQGGQTFQGGLSFGPADSGTPANPVTVGSYGTGRATIASGALPGLSGQSGLQGFVVQDLVFIGGGNAQAGEPGLRFVGSTSLAARSDYLRVNNVDVSQYGSYGIILRDGSGTAQGGWQDVQITNSVVHDNRDSGICVEGFQKVGATTYSNANIYIGHDTVYNNTGYAGTTCSTGNGIVLGDVTGATIERCTAYSNGLLCNTTGGGPVGIWSYDSNAVTVQHCESYGNGATSNTDGGGFDIDGGDTNCIVQYCYSHDNQGAGYLFAQYTGAVRPSSNNTVRFNISQNDGTRYLTHGEGAVSIWNQTNDVTQMSQEYCYNNTVYSQVSPLLVANTAFGAVTVANNVFYASGGQSIAKIGQKSYTGLHLMGNDYFSTGGGLDLAWGNTVYTSLATFRAKTGQEMLNGVAVGLNADPLLCNPGGGGTVNNADLLETSLNAYKAQPTSPVFNMGVDLVAALGISVGSLDFYGQALPTSGPMDMGTRC